MFDSTNHDVICPQCRRQEVHFDGKVGFHCAACGRQLTSEESKVLVEHEVFQTETEKRS